MSKRSLLIVMAGGLLLAACAHVPAGTWTPPADTSQDQPADEAMEKEGAAIEIQDFTHSPSKMTVKPGATVTVTNRDIAGHSVTSDDGSSFDTGVISTDQTITFTAPTTPGEYAYHCTPHPNMQAILVVEG